MIPRRPKPLCAICADREADTITDWECASGATRTIVACWPCLSPVPDPPEEYEPADLALPRADMPRTWGHGTRDAIIAALRRLGPATALQVATELGATTRNDYSLVHQHLVRLMKLGTLARERSDSDRVTDGGVYRIIGSTASPRLAAALATVATLPDEFTSDEMSAAGGVTGNKLAGLLRVLSTEGMIEMTRKRNTTIVDGACVKRPSAWRKTAKLESRRAS